MSRPIRAMALSLLVLALALAGPGPHAAAGPVTSGASHVAPMASINIGGLFGDENEPDENEPDEGSARAQPEDQGSSSGVPLPVVLVLVALAGIFGGWVYLRVRRLVLRARAWGRDLWARL